MGKVELVALLKNNGTPEDPRAAAPRTRSPPPPPQRPPVYVTLKFDDNRSCRIHSNSDEDKEIVTNKRYVVMPWKVVTMNGKNMSLKEVVDGILSRHESEAKELERREAEREEIEKKCAEYYEAHMKSETQRLNNSVGRLVQS